MIALSQKLGSYQVGLVSVILLSLTLLGVFVLWELSALPVMRCKVLQKVFRWFIGVFFESISVAADNVIQ